MKIPGIKLTAILQTFILLTGCVVLTSFEMESSIARQMERLNRCLVAIKVDNGVFLSWRIMAYEYSNNIGFNVYRNGERINSSPLLTGNYLDKNGNINSLYYVTSIENNIEKDISNPVTVFANNYVSIPIVQPSGGTSPDGVSYNYNANDCSIGDLDGDGEYEIVLKWDPSNSKDNSQSGYTGEVFLDAYKLNGNFLWRINLGKNIRAGAHYTQFIVYDLDGDGRSEIACKIADGTIDGTGGVFGDSTVDYRNSKGYILEGPEYLGVFSGLNGKLLAYTNYIPERGNVSDWGDSYGNRVDRFLACVAYLDGKKPSLVTCRGYYTRSVLVAWDYRSGSIVKRWIFDSNDSGNSDYSCQGNHNLSVADVDGDGKDEIIYGSCTIDDNGKGLYATGLGHGDALHVGDLNPQRNGLEIWQCHETGSGATLRDARTGNILFQWLNSKDVGRACSADLLESYPGEEIWATGSSLFNQDGIVVGASPSSCNFVIWWDGDELRELLDDIIISKYGKGTLLQAIGCSSNNGTKKTPCLVADIFGDWREEVIWRTEDNNYLRIYTTTDITNRRIYTLMHDPMYRLSIVWQNVGYNQPPHPSFFIGAGMSDPPKPVIYLVP
ncbi:rhamnogalacturonan lyase [Treponema sp. J25]|uniref:rhamnogalacturonan lyase n=1 Tax=Treponema sp. J25 TaxID=2094121 RepID=UPI0014053E83|nr:rhamnogalacturonan lyase [Treponema sp. J25]